MYEKLRPYYFYKEARHMQLKAHATNLIRRQIIAGITNNLNLGLV